MAKQIKRQDISEEDLFKSVRDSAESTLKKINELNTSLKESASVLKKDLAESNTQSAKDIEKLTQATNEAKKAKEAALKLDQEKIKVEQQLIKVNQELEKLEQQKLRTEREAIKNAQILEKEAQKAIKASQDESNVYKQKSALLNNLRNEYKNLAAQNKQNTAEAQALLTQVSALDKELKTIDATVGQHQRNVGNYSSALAGLDERMKTGNLTIREQSKLMKEYQTIALQAGTETAIGREAIKRAAELKDRLSDVNVRTKILSSDTLKLDTALAGLGFGASVFQGIQGAMALAGVESKELMAVMVRLQAVQAVSNSINQIATALNKDQLLGIQLRIGLEKMKTYFLGQGTTATIANTAATTAQAGATTVATGATRLLGLAMKALPIVAIVGGITLLVGFLYKLSTSNKEAAAAIKKRREEDERANKVAQEAREHIAKESAAFVGLIVQLKATNKNSAERKDLINDINKQYGTTLQNLTDETAFQNQLNQAVADYISFQRIKFQISKNEEAINNNLIKQSKLQAELREVNKNLLNAEFAAAAEIAKFAGQDVSAERLVSVQNLERLKKAQKDLTDELAAANQRLDGYGLSQLKLNQQIKGNYTPTTVKQTKAVKEQGDAYIYLTTQLKELSKTSAFDPDAVEKTMMLEKERAVIIENIAVLDAEIALARAKQTNDTAAIAAAEEQIKKAKIDAINAQLKFELLSETDPAKRVKLEKQAALDILNINNQIVKNEKETSEAVIATINAVADAQKAASDKRMKLIDQEIAAAQKQFDYFQGLAANGNINAKESLAEQQRLIVEANKQKEKEMRRQARIELAVSAYNAYQKNVEDKSVKNPLAKTITDITLLSQFIQNLPAFLDGTEDTGKNGQGIDGKGGFQAILHPNERVLTKEQNQMIGSLTNNELAKIAMEYNTGSLMRKGDGAMQIGGAWQTAAIVKELNELKSIIKTKPETNIELGEIVSGAMEIVKTTRKGNDVIYNRYRIK
jgi:myosin heavy subunit